MINNNILKFLSETDKIKYKTLEKSVFNFGISGKDFIEGSAKMETFLLETEKKYPLSKIREQVLYSSYRHLAREYRLWIERGIISTTDRHPDMDAYKQMAEHARNLLIFYNKDLENTTTREAKKHIFNKMISIFPSETFEDNLKRGELFLRLGDFLQPNETIQLKDFGEAGARYQKDDLYLLSARYSSLAYKNGDQESPAFLQMQTALDKVKNPQKIERYLRKTFNTRFIELADLWKAQKNSRG